MILCRTPAVQFFGLAMFLANPLHSFFSFSISKRFHGREAAEERFRFRASPTRQTPARFVENHSNFIWTRNNEILNILGAELSNARLNHTYIYDLDK